MDTNALIWFMNGDPLDGAGNYGDAITVTVHLISKRSPD